VHCRLRALRRAENIPVQQSYNQGTFVKRRCGATGGHKRRPATLGSLQTYKPQHAGNRSELLQRRRPRGAAIGLIHSRSIIRPDDFTLKSSGSFWACFGGAPFPHPGRCTWGAYESYVTDCFRPVPCEKNGSTTQFTVIIGGTCGHARGQNLTLDARQYWPYKFINRRGRTAFTTLSPGDNGNLPCEKRQKA